MFEDQLSLWNDTSTKVQIIEFVKAVTDPRGSSFVSPEGRIAVFDNDGTLWCEKPMYIQLDFIMRRWVEMASADPALREQQPWKAAVERDFEWLGNVVTKHYRGDDSDLPALVKAFLAAFENIPVEELTERAGQFLKTQVHPTLKRPYRDCAYAPMIELLRYLERNGFTNYIASGGGRDFMRAITQEMYGIPPERVIGSSSALEFRGGGNEGDVFTQSRLDVLDDGPVKPLRIWSRIGRRPILVVGNSDGDIPMLQFAAKAPRPALRLLVLHDDAKREFEYTAGAEKSLELARRYSWTIVSMKEDFARMFPGAGD